jgi:outer membrane lipoprotein SlyB
MSKLLGLMLVAVLSLSGCAGGLGNSDYSRAQARAGQNVEEGVVTKVRVVKIEGTKTPVGAGAGAAVGGVLGSQVGKGSGNIIGGILGGVGGGVAGAGAEEVITRQKGLEITVKLTSGRKIAVTQAADEEFKVGDKVAVLVDGSGTTRVTHDD